MIFLRRRAGAEMVHAVAKWLVTLTIMFVAVTFRALYSCKLEIFLRFLCWMCALPSPAPILDNDIKVLF